MQFNSEMNNLSLYIPHVFPNFTSEYISSTFECMGIGKVDHVDLVSKLDRQGKPYNAAYIHFDYWYEGLIAKNFQARVLDPEREAHIIHNDPWYWIVLENTAKKQSPGDRKICIDLAEGLSLPEPEVIILTEDQETEIDNLIKSIYKEDMDISCDIEEDEIDRLQQEIKMLYSTIDLQIKHAEECHKKIESLRSENIRQQEMLMDVNEQLAELANEKDEIYEELEEQLNMAENELSIEKENKKIYDRSY